MEKNQRHGLIVGISRYSFLNLHTDAEAELILKPYRLERPNDCYVVFGVHLTGYVFTLPTLHKNDLAVAYFKLRVILARRWKLMSKRNINTQILLC